MCKNEYDIGHMIVTVKAPGREEEALAILRANGAHNQGGQRPAQTVLSQYCSSVHNI